MVKEKYFECAHAVLVAIRQTDLKDVTSQVHESRVQSCQIHKLPMVLLEGRGIRFWTCLYCDKECACH